MDSTKDLDSTAVFQKLKQAEVEFDHKNIKEAIDYCTSVAKSLQPYVNNLKKTERQSKHTDTPGKNKVLSKLSDFTTVSHSLSHEKEPIEFLGIGELTHLVTSPPGGTCTEGKFGKAFAIYGEDFARSVFKIVKKTSVPTLESLARWSLIGLLETFCHNILTSGITPEFKEGPDPVLFCPVHDSGVARFNHSVYPTTTALSNLVRKFVQDLDLNHLIWTLSMPSLSSDLPVSFHTDLFLKQKALSIAKSNSNCFDFSFMLKQPEVQGDLALFYALACLKRAHCYFVTDQYTQALEEASAVLKVPTDLIDCIKITAHVLKAKSSYRIGKAAQEASRLVTEEVDKWKAQLEYLQYYRTSASNFAHALELMNESEFSSVMHDCNVEMAICLQEVLAAQRSECQPKTCCLCWRNAPLRGSHVIPRFILAKFSDEVGIIAGDQLKGPKQIRYRMLCSDCEQRFCTWGEKPFCDLYFEKVLQNSSKKLEILYGHWMYYFFTSLMWRICFVFKYKATNFPAILSNTPIFAMRRFLLTGKIQYLTTDCLIYLFIDKHVFDEKYCIMSSYKTFARRGIGCCFQTEECLFICNFFNFYVVFPVGTVKNAFLMQGSLKRLRFGEGVFLIEEDQQRSMPVFLERFLCDEAADEYDKVLSSLPHRTYNKISQSVGGGSDSKNTFTPKIIKCLPSNISVTFNSMFKYGIEIQSDRRIVVKYPPIDCELAEESHKRYAIYLCEENEGNHLALYRVYSQNSDHIYAFQFSVTNTGEVEQFKPCENVKNSQYVEMLQNSNAALEDFLESIISAMLLSEAPPLEVHFFPDSAQGLCQLSPDGNLLLPSAFSNIGRPADFKDVTIWLCKFEDFESIAIVRLFCEIAYDEIAPYDSLVALRFQSEQGKVVSIEPMCPTVNEDKEIDKLLHELNTVCIETIELLQDLRFQNHCVVNCLPIQMHLEFFPIENATSMEGIMVLNELGTKSDVAFKFHSWLCSYTVKTTSDCCLIILQKWKISTLYFLVAFRIERAENGPLQISRLSTLSGAQYVSIFTKMVKDYCFNDFNIVNRNLILCVESILKVNSRANTILTTGCDPLTKSEINSFNEPNISVNDDSSCLVEEAVTLDPLVCLPPGCNLDTNGGTETLHLSDDYSLVCDALTTPLYTVWLCVYKDVHELIVVKTKSGIEYVCSCVVVTLDFVTAQTQTTHSMRQFKLYPYSNLNQDEISFVEDDFLASDAFQSDDCQFSVLMACIQILLSQMYQLYNLQVYLPSEFQIEMTPDGELEAVYPHPFIAGPLIQEMPDLILSCWLCGEDLGMVRWVKKSTRCLFITALTFEYTGSIVSKLELVNLPTGLHFLAQSTLYLEQNLSYMIASQLKILCDRYVTGETFKLP